MIRNLIIILIIMTEICIISAGNLDDDHGYFIFLSTFLCSVIHCGTEVHVQLIQ